MSTACTQGTSVDAFQGRATAQPNAADAAVVAAYDGSLPSTDPVPSADAASPPMDVVDAATPPTQPQGPQPSGGQTSPTGPTGSTGNDAGSGAAQLVNPAPGSKFFVGANFWNIDWQGTDQYFKPGVDFATTTDPWRADLLQELAPYSVLRFMDWNLINDANNPQANWDQRKKPTDSQSSPVAYEWQIDLCNRTKKDYWVNIPWQADPADYAGKLAALIQEKLDPSLRVYVEWANEVWNGAFTVANYAGQQGRSLGLPGDNPAMSYQVYQSVRAFAAFEKVFGKGNPRLVKVMAGMAAWTGPCESQMAALQNPAINPDGIKADAFAVAPYLSGTSMQELTNNLGTVASWMQSNQACAAKAQLPLISYEGGTDSAAGNCSTLQRDPGMRALYKSYLDSVANAGLKGPYMQYTHSGNCWGLKVNTGDSLDSAPKYAGLLDWLAAHP